MRQPFINELLSLQNSPESALEARIASLALFREESNASLLSRELDEGRKESLFQEHRLFLKHLHEVIRQSETQEELEQEVSSLVIQENFPKRPSVSLLKMILEIEFFQKHTG